VAGVLYVGDLHLGSYTSDVFSLLRLLDSVRSRGLKCSEVIATGDFIDGMDKYETQSYKQFPESLAVQRELLKWFVELVVNELDPERVVFVLGNHDRDFRGGFIDAELMERAYPVKFVSRYVDSNDMLVLHELDRNGSFSGWTPQKVAGAMALIRREEQRSGRRIRGLIVGHYHRDLTMKMVSGLKLITLPAFMRSDRSNSWDALYDPALLYMEGSTMLIIAPEHPVEIEEVKRFVSTLIAEIMKGPERRRRLASIDAALSLAPREDIDPPESSDVLRIVAYGKTRIVRRDLLERIVDMARKGMRKSEIARALGVSRSCVRDVIRWAMDSGLLPTQP